jgi:CheY-like chemotaxis protein
MPALRHILIAESESYVCAMLARIVARTYPACHISVSSAGPNALVIAESHGVDLLIATYRLPTLSGLDLVRALRARHIALPIVFLSSDPLETPALAAGANRFLRKPFSVADLQRALRELLPP